MERLSDATGLVFSNPRGKPLSDATLGQLIKELGIAAVPHGFRSSFRDWAAEQTNTPREVVEAALAHTVRNPTETAYTRSDLFERRRRLMDDWSAYLRGAQEQVWPGPVQVELEPGARRHGNARHACDVGFTARPVAFLFLSTCRELQGRRRKTAIHRARSHNSAGARGWVATVEEGRRVPSAGPCGGSFLRYTSIFTGGP